ncbi:MAG TPA: hypothetical protein VKT32_10690 [Chthonomonadaceae bacterium]|nr:hypothetical protein [Chthonomonadaceae bacterium]
MSDIMHSPIRDVITALSSLREICLSFRQREGIVFDGGEAHKDSPATHYIFQEKHAMFADFLRSAQQRMIKSAARGYVALTSQFHDAVQTARHEQETPTAPRTETSKPRSTRTPTAKSSTASSKRAATAKQAAASESSATAPKKRGRKPGTAKAGAAKKTRVSRNGRAAAPAPTHEPPAALSHTSETERPVETTSPTPRTRKTRAPKKTAAKRKGAVSKTTESTPPTAKKRGRPRKAESRAAQSETTGAVETTTNGHSDGKAEQEHTHSHDSEPQQASEG